MATSSGTPEPMERRPLQLSWSAAVTIVATIVGLVILQRTFVAAHRPISWAAAAVVTAILLDPVVDRLAVHIRRVPAVLLTFLVLGGATLGALYLVFEEVQQAAQQLEVDAPEAAATIEGRSDRIGEVARDFRLGERVGSFVDALEERVTGGDDVLRTTAGTAPAYLVGAILTIFLMTYGPRMARAALEQDHDEARRERVVDVVVPAVGHARTALVLTVTLGVVVAAAVTLMAAALGLPAPAGIGAAAGLFALLPNVGVVVGSLPLLLLTLGFRSATEAALLTVGVVALQALDSLVVRPWISDRSLPIGLFAPWAAALLGFSVYGVGGAVFGLAYGVFALAVLDQLDRQHQTSPA
jgi:predicted PurR-regulated permease PerM